MKKVGIIVGSVRPNRRSMQVANWLKVQVKKSTKVQFDIIDLKEVNLLMTDEPKIPDLGLYVHEKTRKWSELVQSYDGFVLVFPQYNWGYPAVLKNAIDYLGKEWQGKPVSLVTFGGHSGSQAQIAMELVVTGLKMAALPVDLQVNLLPDDSTSTADRKLNTYNTQAALLKTAFENELS